MKVIKKCLPDVLAVLLFALLAFAYFFPADIDGRILYRHDHSAGRGMGQEAVDYHNRTGEYTRWTNSAFCGMPTYQSSPSYHSQDVLSAASKAYHLWLPENVWYVFAYLLGFYILLRAFDFRQSLAALGSILWSFSTYFLIIIAAGHIWKVMALAYLPPMIAGVILALRGRYAQAFVVTAIFSGLEVLANHVQMTYYFLFVIFFMLVAYLIDAIRNKTLPAFAKAVATCAAGAIVGIALNTSNLYHTWEYSKESMRGKSEIVKANSSNQTDSGLERDYITQWSYGIDETWTLMVPNTKGGASMPLSYNETAMEHADNMYLGIYQQIGQYWGEQPGTSGPVYVGAFVMFLFVLSLFIVKGPIKCAMLAATILSILLSWGHNFMWFTDIFIDYVPMYSKFRTVASILVIAEFTIPLMAMLALKEIISDPQLLTRKIRWVYLSFGLTAGLCLLFALMPGVFFSDFVSSSEMRSLSQIPQEQLQPLLANLTEMRKAMFTSDCWRSFLIIVVGTLLLLVYKAGKIKALPLTIALMVICLADLWQINKRYLNDSMFVEKSVREQPITKTQAEEQILNDQSLYFRTLNLTTNTFNENETSYYLKSIGGYHPAKLRRYQELIEAYIHPEMNKIYGAVAQAGGDMTQVNGDSIFPVLNMLNAKYFILPLQNGQQVPLQNPYVHGNAWFVDNVKYVDNANEELDMLGKLSLRHEAVADKRFAEILGKSVPQDSTSIVTLTAYDANELKYDVNSATGGIIVFSDIYYPGWTATVDGQDVAVGRVDYVLMAINVGKGQHKVVLTFKPKSVEITEGIAYCAYAVLFIAMLFIAYNEYKKRKILKDGNKE